MFILFYFCMKYFEVWNKALFSLCFLLPLLYDKSQRFDVKLLNNLKCFATDQNVLIFIRCYTKFLLNHFYKCQSDCCSPHRFLVAILLCTPRLNKVFAKQSSLLLSWVLYWMNWILQTAQFLAQSKVIQLVIPSLLVNQSLVLGKVVLYAIHFLLSDQSLVPGKVV